MKSFWDLEHLDADKVAFIDEQGSQYTYKEIQQLVKAWRQRLPLQRALVLLKVRNDLDTALAYLACLQAGHPLMLIDADLAPALSQSLLDTYRPNFVIDGKLLKNHNPETVQLHPELALMLSTSGSTGSPKLVRLSYDNVQANADSIISYLRLTAMEVAITTMPLHYSFGLSILNSHLAIGAKIVLTSKSLMTREFWQYVQDHQVTSLSGVPYIYQMLRKMRYERFNTNSVRYLAQAGGKLDTDTTCYFVEQCNKKNQNFFVMYGQTEATARITYLPPEKLNQKLGSIGIAIPGGRLFIRTEQGELTEQSGVEGELVYQGPNVMLGYAESVNDLVMGDSNKGWLDTGDIGYRDADGFFFITGRAKRFIKIYGLRISLDVVDELLAVQMVQAASTGRDDKLYIFVEDKLDSALSDIATELAVILKININAISVHGITTIPRTTNGKVDGKALKALMETYE